MDRFWGGARLFSGEGFLIQHDKSLSKRREISSRGGGERGGEGVVQVLTRIHFGWEGGEGAGRESVCLNTNPFWLGRGRGSGEGSVRVLTRIHCWFLVGG